MDDVADPNREIVIKRLMERIEGVAADLDLDQETMRHIVERVIIDMPFSPDEDRLVRVRNWMLIASA